MISKIETSSRRRESLPSSEAIFKKFNFLTQNEFISQRQNFNLGQTV
jgi:hypothetical protein